MGGNALKEYGVERVNKETFLRISEFVKLKLIDVCVNVGIPKYLPTKQDFGDVDVLAVFTDDDINIMEWIDDNFKPRVIKCNNNIYSFNVENLQIDLILTTRENFHVYYNFLCWGDFSITIGRLAKTYELKFGIYGLEFPIRDPHTNHVLASIPISKDPEAIYTLLGFDYEVLKKGFETEEELRDFVFSSKLITKRFLSPEFINFKHRKRDKKRGQFRDWCKYFEANIDKFPEHSAEHIPDTIAELLRFIDVRFPDARIIFEYNKFFRDIELNKQAWTNEWNTPAERNKYILTTDILTLYEHMSSIVESFHKKS